MVGPQESYSEFLNCNETLPTDRIFSNWNGYKKKKLVEKRFVLVNRKEVVLLHNYARPRAVKLAQQKILELVWSVLPHPPYSLNITPTE